MQQGDLWRSTASAGWLLGKQIPKVNAQEVEGEMRSAQV